MSDNRPGPSLVAQILGTAFPYSQYSPAGLLTQEEGPVQDPQLLLALRRRMQQAGAAIPGMLPSKEQLIGTAFPYSQYGPAGLLSQQEGPIQEFDFMNTPAGQAAAAFQQAGMASAPQPPMQGMTTPQLSMPQVPPNAAQLGVSGPQPGQIPQIPPNLGALGNSGPQRMDMKSLTDLAAVAGGYAGPQDQVNDAIAAFDPVKLDPLHPEQQAKIAAEIPAVGAGEGSPLSAIPIPGAAPYDLQGAQELAQRGQENLSNFAGVSGQLLQDLGPLAKQIASGYFPVDTVNQAFDNLGPAAAEFAAGNPSKAVGAAIRAPAQAIYGAGAELAGQVGTAGQAVGGEALDFLRGLTGSELDFGGAAGPTAAQLPPGEAPPTEKPQPKSEMESMLEALTRDLLADNNGGGQAAASFSVESRGGRGGTASGESQAPTQGPVQQAPEDKTLERIQKRLDEMATRSTLPPETFKDRLTKMMVGIAIGYSNAYAQNPDFGRAGVAGLAGGVQNLAASDEQRQRDQMRLDEQYQKTLGDVVGVEQGIYATQSRARSDERQAQLYAQNIAQTRENAIMNARSRVAAAQIRAMQANSPLERLKTFKEVLGITKEIRDLGKSQQETVFDKQKIDFGTGPVEIGQLQGRLKFQAIAANAAPVLDPQNFQEALASVAQEFADDATIIQDQGGDPEAFLKAKATARLMLLYEQQPELAKSVLKKLGAQ